MTDATSLLIAPDPNLFRMLHSQGIDRVTLAIPHCDGVPATDPRSAWRVVEHDHLFRGTSPRM